MHDLSNCAANDAENHAGNDAGGGDEVLLTQRIGEEHGAGEAGCGVCVSGGQPVEGIGPDEAHENRNNHEHH